MIKDNDIISPYQITAITIMTLIGVGIFSLPRELAEAAGTNSVIMVLIGGILSLFAMGILVTLNCRFPGKALPAYSGEIIGKVPAKVLTFIYIIYFTAFIGYEARVMGEAVKLFLLSNTPPEVIILSIILACTYAVRGGVECIGRAMEVFFPFLFIPMILIMLPGITDADFSNLLPVFYGLPSKFFKALPVMALSFSGYGLLLFYVGFMKKPKKAYIYASVGIAIVTVFYMLIVVLCLSMFGVKVVEGMIWPLLSYVRSVNLPGLFIERLDGVMLGIWVFAVYTTMISFYFALTYSLSCLLGTKEQKQFALIMVPFIYLASVLPQNFAQVDKVPVYLIQYFGSVLIFIVPLLLLIIAWIRKKGGSKNEG